MLVCGVKWGTLWFLPPGLLHRWAWHTGLLSPDSQISSPLARWSWAANPLPPVSELQCSANDRGLKKKISLMLEIRQVIITLPWLFSVPHYWLFWPYILLRFPKKTLKNFWRQVPSEQSQMKITHKMDFHLILSGTSLNYHFCKQGVKRLPIYVHWLTSPSDCKNTEGHCQTAQMSKCFC